MSAVSITLSTDSTKVSGILAAVISADGPIPSVAATGLPQYTAAQYIQLHLVTHIKTLVQQYNSSVAAQQAVQAVVPDGGLVA